MEKEKWEYHNRRYKHRGICTDVQKYISNGVRLVYYVDENGDPFEEEERDVWLHKIETKPCGVHFYSFF